MKKTAEEYYVRKAGERGHARHGWLDSHHTFSFADYYDPAHMGFRSLRVINDDCVAPGMGFGTHPHSEMEIFSYVMEGTIEHRDSMGNGRQLTSGQIQLMSAGTGIAHSEFNPSRTEPLKFLQIWILPQRRGLVPNYTEWSPGPGQEKAAKVLLISPDGREGSARIRQDAEIYRIRLGAGESATHELRPGRGAWLHVVKGTMLLNGIPLSSGDGIGTEQDGLITLSGIDGAEALLFDLN
ncbi:MAG: pirin family protein [Verrucomicrobia bacterium]|nr:pirin family protein [Verrucomicrobiota bacterium]